MEIDEAYKGREHSLIKHELLKGYLEKLLSIIGVSGGSREIVYVDCFAGPWGTDSESLAGTSIAISLDIISHVREMLANKHGMTGVRFKAIYVEKSKRSHKRLTTYLSGNCPDGITCHALQGDYADLQDEILQLCGDNSFAFFFVDPKGWTDVSVNKLSKLLRRPRSEFLINFMYDFLNRAIGMPDFRHQVQKSLGELTEGDLQRLSAMSAKDRGEAVVRMYREQLKADMGPDGNYPARSYHAEILNKDKERTHYHLVYLTRHHKGIVKFAESSQDADFIQRVVRIQTRQNAKEQMPLFSAEDEAESQDSSKASIDDVKAYWLNQLSGEPVRFDEARLADMLEETGWLIRDFEVAMADLISELKVENLDAAGKRTKHPVHFDKGERLRRCV
ncbi:MAG: three-Cys-motif partner protein TcmP [Gammaproteobacteria bacterium]|nr:three-Cys-motif partner protein TcmP [Gammaproteobacteria bacterium]